MRMITSLGAWAVLAMAACGDDDAGMGEPTDGGTTDTGASRDAGRRDAGRADAGTDAGPLTPVPTCDPFTTGDCGTDEKCSVVIDRGPEDPVLFFGCVPISTGAKAEGLPCGRLNQDA